MNNITLFDPSLHNNQGAVSANLGDIIIYEAVAKVFDEIFSSFDINRVATHSFPERNILRNIGKSKYIMVGGTNLLSSHVKEYNQWKLSQKKYTYIFPPIRNAILLGVGWWQYQDKPDRITQKFYKKILSNKFIHSVRDTYTKNMLLEMGVKNVINTSCPTLWGLDCYETNRTKKEITKCVFTLTDYYQNPDLDSMLIKTLLKYFSEINYFPQGQGDIAYLKSLKIFKEKEYRFNILPTLDEFYKVLKKGEITYVGTRLHGGIKAMQQGVESLIIAVDNRAIEIHNDTNLPVIKRDNIEKIEKWLMGASLFEKIVLDNEAINKWKKQFIL